MSPTNSREQDVPGAAQAHAAEQRFREILTADIDIRIARDGTWYHEGGAIRRPALVKLFASILSRDDSGDYHLVTPAERRRITVEDVPFQAVEVDSEGAGDRQKLIFRTNVDDIVTAGPDHPLRVVFDPGTLEPSPYVMVRGGMEARIARPVYYQLVALGEVAEIEGRAALVVRSSGAAFVLGHVDDDIG